MKYITAIFYQEDGMNKVVYLTNPYEYPLEAHEWTEDQEKKFSTKKNVKDVHARTFEIGVPSYDLR